MIFTVIGSVTMGYVPLGVYFPFSAVSDALHPLMITHAISAVAHTIPVILFIFPP